jgi:hypothetical protein
MKINFYLAALLSTSLLFSDIAPSLNEAEQLSEIYSNINSVDNSSSIDPIQRARDYETAFKQIITANPKAKVYIVVKGISVSRIRSFEIMPQGTTVLVSYKIGSRVKQKIIKVEDIEEFGTR